MKVEIDFSEIEWRALQLCAAASGTATGKTPEQLVDEVVKEWLANDLEGVAGLLSVDRQVQHEGE